MLGVKGFISSPLYFLRLPDLQPFLSNITSLGHEPAALNGGVSSTAQFWRWLHWMGKFKVILLNKMLIKISSWFIWCMNWRNGFGFRVVGMRNEITLTSWHLLCLDCLKWLTTEQHTQGHILLKIFPSLGWHYSVNHIHAGRGQTSLGY